MYQKTFFKMEMVSGQLNQFGIACITCFTLRSPRSKIDAMILSTQRSPRETIRIKSFSPVFAS